MAVAKSVTELHSSASGPLLCHTIPLGFDTWCLGSDCVKM